MFACYVDISQGFWFSIIYANYTGMIGVIISLLAGCQLADYWLVLPFLQSNDVNDGMENSVSSSNDKEAMYYNLI